MHELAEANVLRYYAREVIKAGTSCSFQTRQLHLTARILPFHDAMIELELAVPELVVHSLMQLSRSHTPAPPLLHCPCRANEPATNVAKD